ncbi:Hsp70 family protein [Pseudonocardia sp. RS11V-5]|uniref:Hsp70 family protein n=1 Tax=Pseudonocardia terrae TaxID=2905831 RepID=UPI001E2C8FA6|nr:Hsp70 family protein [Pseudonocardia terrae]MCE3554319.1 Hsp70 family protein [Pseudonocardia terrae]
MGYSLGIDLGTTYTAAAVDRRGAVEMATLGDRTAAIPSVVLMRSDGPVLTGDAANRRAMMEPDRVAREFKRRLGDPTPLVLGGAPHSVASVLASLLHAVVDKVADREGGPAEHVVLTHPANWGPYKLELFGSVPRIAEVEHVTLTTEPEAAAAHYATNERVPDGAIIAVYDFGGGTFDATVLRHRGGSGFETLGVPEGVEGLGGIDFDEAVFAFVDRTLDGAVTSLDHGDRQTASALLRLRQECVLAKETLSFDIETIIPVLLPGLQTEVRLTRAELEEMMRPSIEATVRALHRALRTAKVEPEDLHAVLLVGGSSRIPLVSQMVSEALGRPTAVDAHPKHVVALGAAALAGAYEEPSGNGIGAAETTADPRSGGDVAMADGAPAASGGGAPPGGTAVGGVAAGLVAASAASTAEAPPSGPPAEAPPAPAQPPVPPAAAPAAVPASAAPVQQPAAPEEPPPVSPPSEPVRPAPLTDPRAAGGASPGGAGGGAGAGSGVGGGVGAGVDDGGTAVTAPPDLPTGPPAGPPPLAGPGSGRPRRPLRIVLAVVAVVVVLAGAGIGVYLFRGGGSSPATSTPPGVTASIPDPTVSGTVPVGKNPQDVLLSPDGRTAYVVNSGSNSISLVDTGTNAITATVPVSNGPPQFASISPDGARLYVSVYDPGTSATTAVNTVDVVDTGSHSITHIIPVGLHPYASAVSPDGNTILVPNHDSADISVIDWRTRSVVARIPVKPNPHFVAFTKDGSKAFVADHESNVVSVLDVQSRTVTAVIPVGRSPHSLAVSPDQSSVYVVDYDQNTVSVIDVASEKVTGTIPVGANPQSVVFAPDGRHAYVANNGDGTVSVIDTGTRAVVSTVQVGRSPTTIAVAPDGRTAYVTNFDDNTLSVLRTAA